MTLQEVLQKAVDDAGVYTADAAKVVDDKKTLSADEAKADTSGATARDSASAGIAALTDLLSKLPAAPSNPPAA